MTSRSVFATLLRTTVVGALAALGLASAPALASAKKVCVYDPAGASGPAFQNAKEFQAVASGWGITSELKPYTDESVAAADFRNGQCDAALITGVRVQQFNKKTYSVEAIGLVPNYDVLKKALTVLASPKAAGLMKSGAYETAAIFPAGEVLLFVNDRNMNDINKVAGKKVCTMSFDPAARMMVEKIGASTEPADVGTFASKFNNGSCDVAYAPAGAYKPLELHKGIGANGGVVDFPLTQMTLQLLIRTDDFPDGFGQKAREWSVSQFEAYRSLLTKIDGDIPAGQRISIAGDKEASYRKLLADARKALVANGTYDPTIVKLIEQLAK